jgi:acetyltransferase-like isoleucine patch superfamily enzyme
VASTGGQLARHVALQVLVPLVSLAFLYRVMPAPSVRILPSVASVATLMVTPVGEAGVPLVAVTAAVAAEVAAAVGAVVAAGTVVAAAVAVGAGVSVLTGVVGTGVLVAAGVAGAHAARSRPKMATAPTQRMVWIFSS